MQETAFDWDLVVDVAVPLVGVIASGLLQYLSERRPKLTYYYGPESSFTIQGTDTERGAERNKSTLYMHSVVVANSGRKTATNVRLGHDVLPLYETHPQMACEKLDLPGGGAELILPILVGGEGVTISYLYSSPIRRTDINTFVKSDEGMATQITVLPTRQYPRWALNIGRFLMLAGVAATLYVVVVLIRAQL